MGSTSIRNVYLCWFIIVNCTWRTQSIRKCGEWESLGIRGRSDNRGGYLGIEINAFRFNIFCFWGVDYTQCD